MCRYSATVKSSTIFLAMHNKYFEADIIIAFILFWDALPSFEKKKYSSVQSKCHHNTRPEAKALGNITIPVNKLLLLRNLHVHVHLP